MQVGKAPGKLDLFPVDGDGAVCALPRLTLRLGYIFDVDGQEPTGTCVFVLQITRGFCIGRMVHDIVLEFAKYEMQHVEKMDADVGRDSS